MKTFPERFNEIIKKFPYTRSILKKLDAGNVLYVVGGSAALYCQGIERAPHDVDIMFETKQHALANQLFNIESTFIERPNVTMYKSSPTNDGSVDFLSDYTVISDSAAYDSQPTHKIFVKVFNTEIALVPAEKIAVFKLIGLREHHYDSKDARDILMHPDFDHKLFWSMVNELKAMRVIEHRLNQFCLSEFTKD